MKQTKQLKKIRRKKALKRRMNIKRAIAKYNNSPKREAKAEGK